MARPGQEIGVGRTLDGQERADGIEWFGEEFDGPQVIAPDEPAQTFFFLICKEIEFKVIGALYINSIDLALFA